MRASRSLRWLSAATLGFTLLVILWGAFVRATGSGAGCGSHWPDCNGEVIPRAASVETIIEFTHRATSGIAGILVLVQLVVALVQLPRGHHIRKAAAVSLFLMITEALVGAGLVIFEMVADNQSIARGYWISGHLVNTFALVAAMSLTTWWAWLPPRPHTEVMPSAWPMSATLGLVVLTGLTGAIAALGDTLFPATSLSDGIAQDLSPSAHTLLQLRISHPIIAVLSTVVGLAALSKIFSNVRDPRLKRLAGTAAALFLAQVAVGIVNLLLLAPTALQLLHLLIADLVWISLVLTVAELRAGREANQTESASTPAQSTT